MKNYSAKAIFGTLTSILLLASCIKKDPDFKSAFKDVNPDAGTMTYTWKKSNVSSTSPVVEVTPAVKRPTGGIIVQPDILKGKGY